MALTCLGAATSPARAQESTLVVFAAASLAEAFTDLGRQFEATYSGVRVRFNFAGSQQLAVQIEHGAAADVFAGADQRWMDHVVTRGLVADSPVAFAGNRLVIVVPAANPGRIESPDDLARPGLKVVLAADAVPAGRYAREALSRRGGDYRRRVLGNVVSEEETVTSVLAKVQLGEADEDAASSCSISPIPTTSSRRTPSLGWHGPLAWIWLSRSLPWFADPKAARRSPVTA
jgi:molybdate transport system substrate-binding protein